MTTLQSLLDLVALDHLPRTGWIQHGITEPESIAGHIVGTSALCAALAPEVEPALDIARVLTIALVHDAPEALTGDLPHGASRHLPEGAKRAMDLGAAAELLEPLGTHLLEAFREYEAAETREARFVKQADKLALGVRLVAYARAGRAGLEEFRAGIENLDTGEFAPLERLRSELLSALRGHAEGPRGRPE